MSKQSKLDGTPGKKPLAPSVKSSVIFGHRML
jgi:hypothetical protein